MKIKKMIKKVSPTLLYALGTAINTHPENVDKATYKTKSIPPITDLVNTYNILNNNHDENSDKKYLNQVVLPKETKFRFVMYQHTPTGSDIASTVSFATNHNAENIDFAFKSMGNGFYAPKRMALVNITEDEYLRLKSEAYMFRDARKDAKSVDNFDPVYQNVLSVRDKTLK